MTTKLRRLRKAQGYSQETLARKARVGRLTILRAEAGTHTPTLGTLRKLARALGVELSDLLRRAR